MTSILQAFLEHEAAIKRSLRRFLSRPQDVDDITQETFVRAFAAASGPEVQAPRAFLFRIAKNLALNERAKWSNSMTDFIADSADPDVIEKGSQPAPDEQVEMRQRLALLSEAVAALPPQCGRVFILRKVRGMSQKDIAERLGISVSTVEKHVATGLLKTSEYLRRHGHGVEARGGRGREVVAPKQVEWLGDERRERTGDE